MRSRRVEVEFELSCMNQRGSRGNIVLSVQERCLLVLKILCEIFLMREGNKEIVRLYNSMKIYWGINSKTRKRFSKQ